MRFNKPTVIFEYHARRSAKTAAKFLDGFKGKIMTDGYKAYASVAEQNELIHFGCWAHAPRKFDEAMRVGEKSGGSLAKTAIEKIALPNKVEKESAEMNATERASYRGTHAAPGVKDFFELVHEYRKMFHQNANSAKRSLTLQTTSICLNDMSNMVTLLSRIITPNPLIVSS